jgi:hypothetical protein
MAGTYGGTQNIEDPDSPASLAEKEDFTRASPDLS